MESFDLKPAQPDDVPLLTEMMGEFYAEDGFPFEADRAREAFTGLIGMPHYGSVLLIHTDGAPAGYIVLTFSYAMEFYGRDGFVDDFYIRKQFRGQGLGKRVLAEVEERVREEGIKVLFLEAHDTLKPHLLDFYAAAGFEKRPCRLMKKIL